MLKSAREKIAIAVFILLLLGGLGLCIAYISGVGHNLNVAASTIDDAAGELEGYSAFVYKGTAQPVADPSSASTDSKSSQTDSSVSTALNQKAQSDGELTPADETAEAQFDEEEQDAEEQTSDKEPLTLASLRTSYLDKDAACYELAVDNPHAYDTYTVVRVGKFSFGLISLHVDDTPEMVLARVTEYKQAEVDFILAITPSLDIIQSLDEQAREQREADETLAQHEETLKDKQAQAEKQSMAAKQSQNGNQALESDAKTEPAAESDQTSQEIPEKQYFSLTDLSIVISTQDEGLLLGGVTVDGVFYDDAALTTELGTLLISPSKVITARDIAID